ncbi:DUF6479 family protein [Streptomyces sp. NPDC048560]|uniref:DUF6479 family protein n=1 Tax=Streptomyces sp. NPDC048560 TaxID=3155488 RepID=UPI00343BCAE3
MDVTRAHGFLAATLADDGGPYGIALPIVGVALVAMIIGAFWLGKRRRDEEPPPPTPEEQPIKPEHRTHIEESGKHISDHFPEDRRGLSPYELGDHGNQPIPPDTDPPRDTR